MNYKGLDRERDTKQRPKNPNWTIFKVNLIAFIIIVAIVEVAMSL